MVEVLWIENLIRSTTMNRAPVAVLNRGPWTPQEDMLLKKYIEANGIGRWSTLPLKAGLMRSGKSCRLRWMNHLRPNVKRGHISPDEEDLIIRLHNLLGNRWSLIAGRVPGRTDSEVKNYWNTHLSKKLSCKPLARNKNVKQIVKEQPLRRVDHKNSRDEAMVNALDDHTLKSRPKNQARMSSLVPDSFGFTLGPVSPPDSIARSLQLKQEHWGGLLDSVLPDANVKCSRTEASSTELEKSDAGVLEGDYKIGRAGVGKDDSDESGGGIAPSVIQMNISYEISDFLPVNRFEQNIGRESCSDLFVSSWNWFDNLLWENEFV